MKLALAFVIALSSFGQVPRPELSISVNGRRNPEIRKEAPVLVRVLVMHSNRLSRAPNLPSLILAPPAKAWYDAIRLRVKGAGGAEKSWNSVLLSPPEQPALTLASRSWIALEWTLDESGSAVLEPGDYQIEAVLEISGASGWNGTAISPPAILRITDAVEASSAQQASEALIRTSLLMRKGATDEAAAAIDALLLAQPDSVRALQLRAELAERAGDPHRALIFVNRALTAARKTYSESGQLQSLIVLRNRIYWTLLQQPPTAPAEQP